MCVSVSVVWVVREPCEDVVFVARPWLLLLVAWLVLVGGLLWRLLLVWLVLLLMLLLWFVRLLLGSMAGGVLLLIRVCVRVRSAGLPL